MFAAKLLGERVFKRHLELCLLWTGELLGLCRSHYTFNSIGLLENIIIVSLFPIDNETLHIHLITYTPPPDRAVAMPGAVCWSGLSLSAAGENDPQRENGTT